MKYLVVHSTMDGSDQVKEIFSEADSAVDFVEEKLKLDGVRQEDISVYSLESVPFAVEQVPVVKLDETSSEESSADVAIDDQPVGEASDERVFSLNG